MSDSLTKPLIEITGLCKWYDNFSALHNINLSILEGEKVVICGPSGSGKSTLIRCINQLEAHQRGSILVNGIEVPRDMKKISEIRREVGMIFQGFNLFPHMAILENLIIGPMRNRGESRTNANNARCITWNVYRLLSSLRNILHSFQAVSSSASQLLGHFVWSQR